MTRVVHISDMHLGPLPVPIGCLSFKQVLGYISWKRKRQFTHDFNVLARLKEDIQAFAPDHICITGDQTNLGTRKEFISSAAWIQDLAQAEKISVIPGNHDAYDRDFEKNMRLYWSSWMLDHLKNEIGPPFFRQAKDVLLIGVSSAVPTAPFMANGRVRDKEIAQLQTMAKDIEEKEFFKILMIHHPPYRRAAPWRRGLHRLKSFQPVLESLEPDLILHGHMHKEMEYSIPCGSYDIPVIGICSASSNGHHFPAAQYNIIDIEPTGSGWSYQVQTREYDPGDKSFRSI